MTLQTREARRFERTGYLALDPKALLQLFVTPDAPPANAEIGGVTVVEVRGPLTQRDDSWCDSYESLSARLTAACESASPAIVLRIDSPGGEVQGCFEAVREFRERCAAAGKQLYAFVEGRACSAAYAIASAAQWIVLSEAATCGSIGVLSTRVDYTQQNAANGIRVAFIASGARKTDGHPDAPITEAELVAEQEVVDSLANIFFELVAEHRGLDATAIAQLDARTLHGAAAINAGLADEVSTFGQLLARIAAGGMERVTMATSYEKARAALEEAAQGDDANAKAAQAALAALKAAEGGGEAGDKEEDPANDKPGEPAGTAAETSGDKPAAEDEKDKKEAAASSGDLAAQAWAKVHELETKMREREARDERARLLASRPDFGPELLSVMKTAPLETVRDMVAKLPKGKIVAATAKRAAADQPDVQPTAGEGQDSGGVTHLPAEQKDKMDRRMGLKQGGPTVVNEPYRMTLSGVPTVTKGAN
jgi:ClpP class serine protease